MVTPGAAAVLQSTPEGVEFTYRSLLNAVVFLGVAYVARVVDLLLNRVADRLVQHRCRVALLIPVAKFRIYGAAVYVVEVLFDLNRTQLIAFAGFLGAALGLGLKDLLADIVGGIVLVLEQPFQVGDTVSLGEHYGEITDIGVRSTTLQTPQDDLVVVPNFTLFNEAVVNSSTGDAEILVVVGFIVAVDADIDRATDIVEDALATSPYVYVSDERPIAVDIEDGRHYRTLRGKAYVDDRRTGVPFRTDVSERVVDTFDREGIESPRV
ncbi:mechanosensitive ion channel family protein [Halobacteriales archaeon QH_10_70_21]|nr:MAG: mechanosensitive ion channel family protein [Halobacteriales archaeon QH_10_70_21]